MPEPYKTEYPHPAAPASTQRAFFTQWGWISLFWLLIALASLLEASWFNVDGFSYYWRLVALQWLPWILLTPVIMWLTARFTIERSTWLKNVWVHLLACILIVGGLGALSYLQLVRPHSQMGALFFRAQGNPPNAPGPVWLGTNYYLNQRRDGPPQDWGRDRPDRWWSNGPPPRGFGGDGPGPGPGFNRDGLPPDSGFLFNLPFRMGPPVAVIIMGFASMQLPTFWAVLGMAHALLFYQRSRDRERRGVVLESRLNQARLQALRMQMNPHFLFNTLNSISSLVYDKPKAADEMITSLSDLLRLTLNTTDRQEVTLREELDFLNQYLFIEETRFGDRLKIERNIEPVTLGAIVPSLILQPIVENAFKHGVEAHLGPGVIEISAKRAGATLLLEVGDNGRGVTPDSTVREGVGLANTRARLRGLYGDRGSLDYGPRPNGGFRVIVQIPWRTDMTSPATPAKT